MQVKVIDINLGKSPKNYSFNPNDLNINLGDKVIVETVKGTEFATANSAIYEVDDSTLPEKFAPVLRIATENDKKIKTENTKKEKEILNKTEELVKKYKLEMKITSVEMAFDKSKVMIFFTSDNRVDFRELVKELANIFKTRIELRQIGSRDEVKQVGGLGPCGRVCCCNSFLNEFAHSSIKMAKSQGLSLNPTKISGLCGRLMCCLSYENEHYNETIKKMPKVGSFVETPNGKGVVVFNNILKEIVQVKHMNGDTFEVKDYALKEVVFPKPTESGEHGGI